MGVQDSNSFYIRQRVNSSGRYQEPDPLLSDAAADMVLVHHRSLILLADTRTAGLGGESRQ